MLEDENHSHFYVWVVCPSLQISASVALEAVLFSCSELR